MPSMPRKLKTMWSQHRSCNPRPWKWHMPNDLSWLFHGFMMYILSFWNGIRPLRKLLNLMSLRVFQYDKLMCPNLKYYTWSDWGCIGSVKWHINDFSNMMWFNNWLVLDKWSMWIATSWRTLSRHDDRLVLILLRRLPSLF